MVYIIIKAVFHKSLLARFMRVHLIPKPVSENFNYYICSVFTERDNLFHLLCVAVIGGRLILLHPTNERVVYADNGSPCWFRPNSNSVKDCCTAIILTGFIGVPVPYHLATPFYYWWTILDLNQGPVGYEPNALTS